jgi:hypothetical protein
MGHRSCVQIDHATRVIIMSCRMIRRELSKEPEDGCETVGQAKKIERTITSVPPRGFLLREGAQIH